MSNPDLIPDWDVIEDPNRCNQATLSKGKKGSPSLTPNQLGQTMTKAENITTTKTENRTATKAENRRHLRLPKLQRQNEQLERCQTPGHRHRYRIPMRN